MEPSRQSLILQNRVLEEENEALKKEVRRLRNRCTVLERFYKEIVVGKRGYFHPAMNLPIDDAGFSTRVFKVLNELGMKVLGDIICYRGGGNSGILGIGPKGHEELQIVLKKHGLELGMNICKVFDDLSLEE